MRSKAPLALMEQLIMVLVFALAAALCLQAFVRADTLSREHEQLDEAVRLAQNTAEVYKACTGDQEQVLSRLGGQVEQGLWHAQFDANLILTDDSDKAAYRAEVFPQPSQVEGLGSAVVSVFLSDGQQAIFSLPLAWQEEVSAHGE